jgi:hypothetical protein
MILAKNLASHLKILSKGPSVVGGVTVGVDEDVTTGATVCACTG